MNWKSVLSDPNDPKVQGTRTQALLRARSPSLIDNREEYLVEQTREKRVLDVGVVAHTPDAYKSKTWLHRHISENAAYCLGCDILGPETEQLRSLGYNVVCHDLTKEPLDETFDVIVLGELIEHVDNPGKLFANCAQMLAPGGKLILTTPNPWFVTFLLKGLFSSRPLVESVDHVAWYDASTLCELANRAGLQLEKYTGIRVSKTYTLKAKVFFAVFYLFARFLLRREALAKSIVYEFGNSEIKP